MRGLYECVPSVLVYSLIVEPCFWDGLSEDPEDGVVRLAPYMMTCLQEHRLKVMTTEVMRSGAVYSACQQNLDLPFEDCRCNQGFPCVTFSR